MAAVLNYGVSGVLGSCQGEVMHAYIVSSPGAAVPPTAGGRLRRQRGRRAAKGDWGEAASTRKQLAQCLFCEFCGCKVR